MMRMSAGLLLFWMPMAVQAVTLPAPHMLSVQVSHQGGEGADARASSTVFAPSAHRLAVVVRHLPGREGAGDGAALPAPHVLTSTVRRLTGGLADVMKESALRMPAAHALNVRVNRRPVLPKRAPVVKVVRVIPQSGMNPFDPQNPAGAANNQPAAPGAVPANNPPAPPGAVPACNATATFSLAAFGVTPGLTLIYYPTTGSCSLTAQTFPGAPLVFDLTQPGNPNVFPSGALLMSGTDPGIPTPNSTPLWSLVNASAGNVTPGTVLAGGQILNLPLNAPVSFTLQCVANCTGTHPGTYSGTVILTNTSASVQGLQ